MKLPLRYTDLVNSYYPKVRVASPEEEIKFGAHKFLFPDGYKILLDAKNKVIALVPAYQYQDWNHPETIAEFLNWASEKYPYLQEGDE